MFIQNMAVGGLELFFPADCLICKQPVKAFNRSFICSRCWQKVELLPDVCCIKCGKPLFFQGAGFQEDTIFPRVCLTCRRNPPYFRRLFSSLVYKGIGAEAIKLFKYGRRRGIIRGFSPFIKRCIDLFRLRCLDFDAVVPVPLHPRRLRERGYNQAEDIARKVAEYLDVPLWNKYLRRVRYTQPQTTLSHKDRGKNIRGAFSVRRKVEHKGRGKRFLLVDDVYTTGLTLNEASLEMGKMRSEVFSFTLARVP